MAMNTVMKLHDSKYDSKELDRPTTAPSYKSTTVIKYMGPRTLGVTLPSNIQGSLRNFSLSKLGSSSMISPTTTSHGLVSLVSKSTLSTISPIQSIDGERTIDEHRELSKLTEKLTETILQCCHLDAHNRAQELQIEFLKTHSNKNSLTIDKMYRTEFQTARELIDDALRYKNDLEKKLHDLHQTTLANDEYYQQLLSKRNTINKDLFNYQQILAQTRAEIEFIRYRLQQFKDEIQFYTLKNNTLEIRKSKLNYELDEEIFAKQVLQMEYEVLSNEKITNEDVHLTLIDNIRGSININNLATIQPSNYYREQLNYQIRFLRTEYDKKIESYRNELHRKFELELHRYQMHQIRPIPNITREHEQKLEEYKREKQNTEQKIGSTRADIHRIINEIEILEKQIHEQRFDTSSIAETQRHLKMLEQIIHEKERQLNNAIQIRTSLKKHIDNYREKANRYPQRITQYSSDIDSSISSSVQEQPSRDIYRFIPALPPKQQQQIFHEIKEKPFEEGTLIRFVEFDVQRDCEELYKTFNEKTIDEIRIIRILCNRSVAQRIQIRDAYKNLYGRNLDYIIETEISGSLQKILKILLQSPIERDCYELRRILKDENIDENILIEIFFTRSNKQIKSIIENYLKLFKNSLEQDILDTKNTVSKQIFLALIQANRPENDEINDNEVLNDARILYETHAKWRVDGSIFIRLLCNRSNEYLKQVFDAYQRFNGIDIEQSIKIDTDPSLSRTLMAIVRIVRNRPRYFAYELRKSLKGSNTNEDNVTRIIVSRCEIDMVQIKSEYKLISKRTLFDQIQTDTTGNYRRVLMELLRQRSEPINTDFLSEQSDLVKKPRLNVKWKEPINTKLYEKSSSHQDISERKQFDRNNKAKSTSLLTFDTKSLRSPYIQRRPYMKRPYTDENQYE